jgi:pimeloyl-ACP methyl ester carboxylesterase
MAGSPHGHCLVARLDLGWGLAWTSGPAARRPPGCAGNRGERSLCLGRPYRRDAVVLPHAWGESWRSFDRLLPLLPGTIRAVAMDLRGHGDADKPATGYSLAEVAADVAAFMDAVGIPSAVLLGSSSGGYVAQQVAITSPHRVAGLVLVGSPRSLQGRPAFAGEVDQLTDPVDAAWVRRFLAWFPRFHPVPLWYIDGQVRDGARMPAYAWRETLAGLVTARPPTRQRSRHLPSSCAAAATSC